MKKKGTIVAGLLMAVVLTGYSVAGMLQLMQLLLKNYSI